MQKKRITPVIEHIVVAITDIVMFVKEYEYPWYKVRSFRNMIALEYFNIKLAAV